LYPTCLTAADCPLHASQHIDGCDLSVVLKEGHLERDALYWHFPHYNKHPFSTPGSVIRRGRWKLIDSFDPESKELYDLETDIGEQHNLASTQPVIMSELLSALSAWRKDVDAERMLPNSDYDPVRAQPKQKKQKKKSATPRQ
jgi:Arylsulfatase A and related enzymes